MLRVTRVVTFVIVALLFAGFSSSSVQAQYGQYQGAPAPAITVEKFVGRAIQNKGGSTSDFVENLSLSDPRFHAGDQVSFKLIVKNPSDAVLTNVEVKDFLPFFLEPFQGPGTFNSSSRTISFNAGDFQPKEEKSYILTTKIVPQNQLPADKGVFCIVNKVQAFNDRVSSEDTSQLCLEKEVANVPQVPATGPELGLVLLGFNAVTLGAGVLLHRYGKKA